MWSNRRILDLTGIEHPIIEAPMAGPGTSALSIGAIKGGGLGSMPCAMLNAEQARNEFNLIKQQAGGPINMNFFCHLDPKADPSRETAWRARLTPYFDEFGLDPNASTNSPNRSPFNSAMCDLMVELKPRVVSFTFGLPPLQDCERLKRAGCLIFGTATTVAEAKWLEDRGADAVVAQGLEAGGHRGMFLSDDIASQVGTFALVPQVVDTVSVPVIAAGGIVDGRGIAAALVLGASAVQIGTAYLLCPEAKLTGAYRKALLQAAGSGTALTNVISGRPARGIVNRIMRDLGPIAEAMPQFPLPAAMIAPLRAKAEAQGSGDFSPLWAGQAASLARPMNAEELTKKLAQDALECLASIAA